MNFALSIYFISPHLYQSIALVISILFVKALVINYLSVFSLIILPVLFLWSPKLGFISVFLFLIFFAKFYRVTLNKYIIILLGFYVAFSIDQLSGLGVSVILSSMIEPLSNHRYFFEQRVGGPQLSPNYYALSLYILALFHFDDKQVIFKKIKIYFALVVLCILSGSKTGVILLLSLLNPNPFVAVGIILLGMIATYFIFFLPRIAETPDIFAWYTISNRIDGYLEVGKYSDYYELILGRDIANYDSAFDSTWSMALYDVGILGFVIVVTLSLFTLRSVYDRFGLIPAIVLGGASVLHPVFYHAVVTPALLISAVSKQKNYV